MKLIFFKRSKGSLTAEAAVILPVFICVLVSVIFFVKVVYTYQVIQHAITQAADEIASESYMLYVSGLYEFGGKVDKCTQGENDLFSSPDNIGDLFMFLEKLYNDEDGSEEEKEANLLKGVINMVSSSMLNDAKNKLFIPIVKQSIKKHIPGDSDDLDTKVRNLNIVDGFEGLDFSRSCFFEGEKSRIDIVVIYRISLPIPFKVYPSLLIKQRASVNAWMGGDEGYNDVKEEDIWALNNMERGKRVREIFGANLPWFFPGISGFYSGKAVLIRSMDLTAVSYNSAAAVGEKISEYIDEFACYKGQTEPWGDEGIVIQGNEIKSKELILVIPKNQMTQEVRNVVYGSVNAAASKGVVLRIEQYGYKNEESSQQD